MSCQRLYATGANPMGAPGCPEFACWTASMASVRMVLMHSVSSCLPLTTVCSPTTMRYSSPHFVETMRIPYPNVSTLIRVRPGGVGFSPPGLRVYQFTAFCGLQAIGCAKTAEENCKGRDADLI